jgi:hypothetical protein
MYSAGSAGACFSALAYTGTNVFTQVTMSCSEGFVSTCLRRIGFLACLEQIS